MKTFIKNRDENDICVVVENPDPQSKKLAFVMHGLGGYKEEPHIRGIVEAFLEADYTVVSWDAVHTFGESKGGSYEDATITNYYADLEDVIAWAKTQTWYIEPFVLCGHSLGGVSTALFAERNPEKVSALAPISTVVSGRLSWETRDESYLDEWKQAGIKVEKRRNGDEKRLKWSHMEDRLKYNLLEHVSVLTMPVFMAVGERDTATPLEHQQLLFDKLPGRKELHVIKGAEHAFYETHEQQELKQLVKAWVTTL